MDKGKTASAQKRRLTFSSSIRIHYIECVRIHVFCSRILLQFNFIAFRNFRRHAHDCRINWCWAQDYLVFVIICGEMAAEMFNDLPADNCHSYICCGDRRIEAAERRICLI